MILIKKIKLVQELEQKRTALKKQFLKQNPKSQLWSCFLKLLLSMRLKKVNYSWQNVNYQMRSMNMKQRGKNSKIIVL